MKAAVQRRYGPLALLRIEEVTRPTPREGEVLVRVHAASVSESDTITRTGRPLIGRLFTGLLRPRRAIQGSEFAGEIEATGRNVTQFSPGDKVFGSTGGFRGCYAEYARMPADVLMAIKPNRMEYEEAASICSALAAWNLLREKAKVRAGQKVLINGAAGIIGTSAVQIAKHFGANVTGVSSPSDTELIKSLGADAVLTAADFTASGERYDIILDAESESSYLRCRHALTKDGIYVRTFPGPMILLQMLWTRWIGHNRAMVSATGLRPIANRRAILDEVRNLIEMGKLRAVIDRCYSLENIADAYRRAEGPHKSGAVVVTMDKES